MAGRCARGLSTGLRGAVSAIALGGEAGQQTHACGLRQDGLVSCGGSDSRGQASPPSGAFTALTAGKLHTCGLRRDGSAECWGDDVDGQSSPPAGSFRAIAAGDAHTCGIRTDGTVTCWGGNESGQASPPSGSFTALAAGEAHTCGIRSDRTLACWGLNASGQATPPAGNFGSVASGARHACGIMNGTVRCWGENDRGQAASPSHFGVTSLGLGERIAAHSKPMALSVAGAMTPTVKAGRTFSRRALPPWRSAALDSSTFAASVRMVGFGVQVQIQPWCFPDLRPVVSRRSSRAAIFAPCDSTTPWLAGTTLI